MDIDVNKLVNQYSPGKEHKPIPGKAAYWGLGKKAYLVVDKTEVLTIQEFNVFQRIQRFFSKVIDGLTGKLGNPVASKLSDHDVEVLESKVKDMQGLTPDQKAGWGDFIARMKEMKYKENKLVLKILNGDTKIVNWDLIDDKSVEKQFICAKFLATQPEFTVAFQEYVTKNKIVFHNTTLTRSIVNFFRSESRDGLRKFYSEKMLIAKMNHKIEALDNKNDVRVRISDPKGAKVAEDFKLLISIPEIHSQFHDYLGKIYSVENLDFLDAVKAFQHKPNKAKAKAIYDNFIKDGSRQTINISGPKMSKIEVAIRDQSSPNFGNIFDEAEGEICNLLISDHLATFLNFSGLLDVLAKLAQPTESGSAAAQQAKPASAPTPVKVEKWEDLQTLMEDPDPKNKKVQEAFKAYLKKELSGENLDFVIAVKDYRTAVEMLNKNENLTSPQRSAAAKPLAIKIFTRYLAQTVDSAQVNLPDDVDGRVKNRLRQIFDQEVRYSNDEKGSFEEDMLKIFNEPAEVIYKLMYEDSWMRFAKTTEFAKLKA